MEKPWPVHYAGNYLAFKQRSARQRPFTGNWHLFVMAIHCHLQTICFDFSSSRLARSFQSVPTVTEMRKVQCSSVTPVVRRPWKHLFVLDLWCAILLLSPETTPSLPSFCSQPLMLCSSIQKACSRALPTFDSLPALLEIGLWIVSSRVHRLGFYASRVFWNNFKEIIITSSSSSSSYYVFMRL